MSSQPDKIYAEFATRGLDEVLKALSTIEDKVLKIEQKSKAAARMASLTAKDTGASVAAANASGAANLASVARRSGNRSVESRAESDYRAFAKRYDTIKENSATYAGKYAAQSAKAETAAKEREYQAFAKRYDTIKENSATMAGKLAADQAKAEAKAVEDAENRKRAIRERSATMAGKFAKQQADAELSAKNKVQQQSERDANRAERQRARDARRAMEDVQARRERHADTIVGAAGRGLQNGLSVMGRAAQMTFSTVTSMGGGFDIQSALNQNLSDERLAALVANKAPGKPASTDEAFKKAGELGIQYGFDRGDVLKARNTFLEVAGANSTKDYEDSNAQTAFFLKAAKATGAHVEDVAKTAGLLKLQNSDLDSAGMQKMLLTAIDQGKRGSIDFREMAGALPSITKTATSYAGDQAMNQAHLLGAAQITRGVGSIAEAGTSLSNLSMDLKAHKDEVNSYFGPNANIFDNRDRIAMPVDELLATIMERTGGKETEAMRMDSPKTVIGRRAIKAMEGAPSKEFFKAKDEYLKNHSGEKDAELMSNKAGGNAVRALFKKAIGDGSYTEANLNQDFANVMKTSAEQFEGAVRQLKQQVGEELVPVLKDLVPTLKQVTPLLVQLLKGLAETAAWFANNPFKAMFIGAAASITAAVTGEIVKAAIGETIKNLVLSSMSGGGGLPVPGGGSLPPGAAPAMGAGAGGSGLLAGGLIGAGVLAQGLALGNLADDVYSSYTKGDALGGQVAKGLSSSDPKAVEAARGQLATLEQQNSGERQAAAYGDIATRALNGLSPSPLGSIVQYGTDWAMEKAGYKSALQNRNETLTAGAALSNDDLQKQLATKSDENTKATEANTQALQELKVAMQSAASQPGQVPVPTPSFSRGPNPTNLGPFAPGGQFGF